MALISSIWLAGCSVFGIREVAEPPFQMVGRVGAIELRQYPPRIAAETTVQAGELQARSIGFRRIAGYIFGGNQTGARIAMTAPVAQSRDPAGAWRVQFFMPAGSTLQNLPRPNAAPVTLATAPAEMFAVLRFSGTSTPGAVSREDARLRRGLEGSGWKTTGTSVAWFYDPPWTLPPLRRNEIAVPVVRSS